MAAICQKFLRLSIVSYRTFSTCSIPVRHSIRPTYIIVLCTETLCWEGEIPNNVLNTQLYMPGNHLNMSHQQLNSFGHVQNQRDLHRSSREEMIPTEACVFLCLFQVMDRVSGQIPASPFLFSFRSSSLLCTFSYEETHWLL